METGPLRSCRRHVGASCEHVARSVRRTVQNVAGGGKPQRKEQFDDLARIAWTLGESLGPQVRARSDLPQQKARSGNLPESFVRDRWLGFGTQHRTSATGVCISVGTARASGSAPVAAVRHRCSPEAQGDPVSGREKAMLATGHYRGGVDSDIRFRDWHFRQGARAGTRTARDWQEDAAQQSGPAAERSLEGN